MESSILPAPASPSLFQQRQRTAIDRFACRLILIIALLLHLIVIQQKRIKCLTKELEEMEQRYENSNSPPSSNSRLYRKMKKERKEARKKNDTVPRRPGRKVGHKGVTQVFEPTERVVHAVTRCPKCNSKNLSVTKTENVRKVEIPMPQPYAVTEHIIPHYECMDCGENAIVPDSAKDIRSEEGGMLGKNILATIAMLYSLARLPYRKIPRVLESLYGLSISAATVWSSLNRISEKLASMEKEVEEKINASPAANFDETSVPVNGIKQWIWVAVAGLFALIIVEKSRGTDVLKKHFSGFKGVACVDGWKSYCVFFAKIQRCWAHILREIETIYLRKKDKNAAAAEEANQLYSELKNLYDKTNLELKDRPPPNQELHDRSLVELKRIISKQYNDPGVRKFASKKLKNASENLLTYTLYSGVESTNNRAERMLREPVVQRKIRGQLKTDQGAVVFGRMMTALATWTIQGLNPFKEFKRLLQGG